MTYHQHYGRENVVRNNILVNGRNFQVSVHRIEPHLSCTFENNIVYFRTGKLFWQPELGDRKLASDRNVYWNAEGAPFDFMGLSFADWQAKGLDAQSVIEDPQFVDPANLDFRLKPDSPALKLGFRPFDYTEAGLHGDPDWVAGAKALRYEPVQFAPDPPPPPPLSLAEDFEDYPVGAPPLNAQVNVENKGDAIAVTDETAASGKQCLKLTDTEGLQYSFNPHLVYNPGYEEGTAVCELDLRLEAGAELWHEWRDWTEPNYTVGPRLQIKDGQVLAADRPLLTVPVGEWLHLRLEAGLGADTTGAWRLEVTVPGEPPQQFEDLPFINGGWSRATWIGFVSNATTRTTLYLDNLRMGLR
jgi:hypothetical protein